MSAKLWLTGLVSPLKGPVSTITGAEGPTVPCGRSMPDLMGRRIGITDDEFYAFRRAHLATRAAAPAEAAE